MPLVRVEVRNEYALGAPELYRERNKEDPKEILEGVAVAGLVGVLRQLGDLAEFAAEVFHGLQEEVTITSSRSHKLVARVQRIEAALSPLEKALLAQRSHLHFAYTAGVNWHARIKSEQNHFVYSDVPQFIMDSYDDCRGPPCLHLLDRFDPGGPGSCLKRYSDPTFFKRASVASGEASADRISKDKKGHKIKKRRSWRRSREVSRDASFSYNSGRMQFTQQNIGGHSSPSQTTSRYDATQRSDLAEQTTLDLRNGSGYIGSDLHPTNSLQPEEESRESISSSVKRRENAYDDIEIYPSQGQAGCSSSSVTWDEKKETLEPTTQDSDNDGVTQDDDHNRHLGSVSPDLDLETLSYDAVHLETVDKMDIQPFDQAVPALESGDTHLDDIESETDNFMDALNTIESECETDTECMKKQEVEHYSKLEDKGVDDGLCEAIRHNLESQSSSSESNVLADSSLINGSHGDNLISLFPKSPHATNCNGEAVKDEFNSDSLVDKDLQSSQNVIDSLTPHATNCNGEAVKDEFNSDSLVDKDLQSSQNVIDSLTPGSPHSVDSYENGNTDAGNNVESVSCTIQSDFRDGTPQMPITDGTRSPESQNHVPETSNTTSVTFWTNGGLLGLQPSKPPDCSILNAPTQDPVYNKDDQTEKFKNIEEGLDKDSSTCHEYQESGASFRKASWKISPADLDIKFGKLVQADRKHQDGSRSSSRMFELSDRLLSTGSNKKLLPGGDQNSYSAGHKNGNAFAQRNHQPVAHRTFSGRGKDLFGGESPILSPSSSPPLGHMKISFQPIDGFETSKLKLKFPDGNTNNESGSAIFPSFQLVPEVSFTRHNVDSDSDADTFYRSSPSLSDDSHSNQSESNTEQWESSESPTSKDRDLYDALRRISLTESVSTVPENGRTNHEETHVNYGIQFPIVENGVQNSASCRSFDLHSLGTINDSFRKELRNDTSPKGLVEPQFAPNPALPPLPPVQWRGMTPHLEGVEDKCEATHEGSHYAFDLTRSETTISQPKPAPLDEDQIDTISTQKSKSFNLRPTVAAKPTVPSVGSAAVQVSAILEKANAIRQAVGSDGEDDGNWTDT
ncbi:hypothetical protein DH2020_009022 [Rehmannia glutinosa]|uniref:Protein SCAR n=1 Tax=Rehmannia glutinosa TaxID=99300 RepID=A0ABR0X8E8_REHGL